MINKDGTVVVGVKGKSGRKCFRDENLRIQVIEKAWLKKQQRMNDGEATQIVVKDMTQKIAGADGKAIIIQFDPRLKDVNSPPPPTKDTDEQSKV